MRRISAIVLLALFGFSLIGPALLSADSDSNLPACCRRDGKHHCAAMFGSGQTSSTGPSFKSGETCPFFPGSFITTAGFDAFIPVVSAAASVPLADHAKVQYSTQASGRLSLNRSHQKRGPPSSPSFA